MEKTKQKVELELLDTDNIMNSQLNTVILMVEHLYNIYNGNSEFKEKVIRRNAMDDMIDIITQELLLLKTKEVSPWKK